MNRTTLLFSLFLFTSFTAKSQMEDYRFTQEIIGIKDQWHKIQIPVHAFKNLKSNKSDVRIFGITNSDTIEAPYLLEESRIEKGTRSVNFKTINKSRNAKGYYYTFVLEDVKSINQILLNLNKRNFNFKVKLEGSNSQNDWYTVLDDYQVIGIQNEFINFAFSTLKFNESKYKYYRLQLKTQSDPNLLSSSISLEESTDAIQDVFTVSNFKQINNSSSKKSVIEFSLTDRLPVSEMQLETAEVSDYYRRYHLSYLVDSTKTEKGYIKNYRSIQSGTMHSFEPTIIHFNTIVAAHFKIEIENNDNAPISVTAAKAKGNQVYLTTRFNKPAKYYLTYGNNNATFPKYDIAYFSEKIPENLTKVELGAIENITQKEAPKIAPLFANSAWMYIILSVIIALLAFFSIKMLKNTKTRD